MGIRATSQLDPILEMFPLLSLNLNGKSRYKLAGYRYSSRTNCDGYLKLYDGYLENAKTGALFDKIECELRCHNKCLTVHTFQAQDREKGKISGAGTLRFDANERLLIHLQFQAKQFYLLNKITSWLP